MKNGFEFRFSFFVFAALWKGDLNFGFRIPFFALLWKEDLTFVFCFSFSHHFEKRIWISVFVFCFSPYFEKRIRLSFFIFRSRIRFEKRIWISFFTFRFCTCGISSFSLPKAWKPVISVFWREYQTVMAALEGVLDKDFVRCFLTQQKHTYEDLVVEINNRYPNLKGCSLRSVKRFCSHYGIRKRMPVCDEALDTSVQTAVSEVRGCKLISNA